MERVLRVARNFFEWALAINGTVLVLQLFLMSRPAVDDVGPGGLLLDGARELQRSGAGAVDRDRSSS
jgi:hypothetical protein